VPSIAGAHHSWFASVEALTTSAWHSTSIPATAQCPTRSGN
jgi:hypothetical protein